MLTEAITTSVISGLFKKFSESALNASIDATKSKISKNALFKKLTDINSNKTYSSNVIKKNFTFRTIISGDKDVFLHEIYYPLKVVSRNESEYLIIKDGVTITKDKLVCLIGVAGQGKTITMRKLFLEELNKNNYFPFFISLRNVDFSKPTGMTDIVLHHLKENGIKCESKDIEEFLQDVKVRFFLDGFDEVPHEHRGNAIKVLDECNYVWGCSVVCSTRPETELTKLSGYVTYTLNFLTENDVVNIVKIHVVNEETCSLLLGLISDKDFLRESIVTPILVDIFIVTSIGLGKNPENVASYYDALFSSLIYKHDFNKIFVRSRKSLLNDVELEDCLAYFSFATYMKQKTTFTRAEMVQIFSEAKRYINKDIENELAIMDDIINMTNLIVNDGFNLYSYIHKSIQDYYAAKFIQAISDEHQKSFWDEVDEECLERNFCYMYKCMSPRNYFNFYIRKLINNSGLLDDDGNVRYIKQQQAIEIICTNQIIFDIKTQEFFGIRSADYSGETIFDMVDKLYILMFFKHTPHSILSPVFAFVSERSDEMISRRDELQMTEADKKFGDESFLYPLKSLVSDYPEFIIYLDKEVVAINEMIREIFSEYNKNIRDKNVREESTMNLIRGFTKR